MYDALKANPALSALELKAKLDAQLKKYQQTVTLETTSPEMLSESLFLPSSIHKEDEVAEQQPPAAEASPVVPAPVPAVKPVAPTPAPEPPRLPSILAGTAAALVSAVVPRRGTSLVRGKRRRQLETAPVQRPAPRAPKKYQRPIVTYHKDSKKTELHHYMKKVRGDSTMDYHVISTTLDQNGQKPVVTHIVEITTTHSSGRVTKSVQRYGDDLPWNASRSKWSAPAVIAESGFSSRLFDRTGSSQAQSGPKAADWHETPFISQPINWTDLASYYHTGEEREKLKGSDGASRAASGRFAVTEEFLIAAKQIYSKSATANMTYGSWLVGH
jgi:hypothetical protein